MNMDVCSTCNGLTNKIHKMFIEDSIHNKFIVTLNLGSFPKSVNKFLESNDVFERLIYIDYQLHCTIRNELKGKELDIKTVVNEENVEIKEKLNQLISLRESLSDKRNYIEKLYETVIFAHLYYLISDIKSVKNILESISIALENRPKISSESEVEFIHMLTCRYYTFAGLIDQDDRSKWDLYLSKLNKSFNISNVSGNKWLEILYIQLLTSLTKNGKISFDNFSKLKLFENKPIAISFGGFLCKYSNQSLIDKKFKDEYSIFFKNEISSKMTNKGAFPDANSSTNEFEYYVENVCETFVKHDNEPLFENTFYKQFLIHSLSTTYQSEVVLSNYIKALIKNNELDEAFGAFKTYISYINKNQEQHKGEIRNILSIIDIYAHSILFFNPLNSILSQSGSKRKFKHTSNYMALEGLSKYVIDLEEYLVCLSKQADINYEIEEFSDNPLSFLYNRYNPNLLETDSSYLIKLISHAWFSLGYFYYYKSTYDSHDFEQLKIHSKKTLDYYKNSLIINPTGDVDYLFNYAITLAYHNDTQPALRLCKFILKKYSNSFKTWNLMALLYTALENGEHANLRVKCNRTKENSYLNNELNGNRQETLTESEKTIENALNIAGIFMNKIKEENNEVSLRIKYEILQLKLTQLAIWEQINGIQYILDYIPEVFLLYFELFDMQIGPKQNNHLIKNDKWSHRPSFIDPTTTENNIHEKRHSKSFQKDIPFVKQNIGHISKSSKANTEFQSNNTKDSDEINTVKRKILQDIWVWSSKIYMKIDLLGEAEQCIVEAESSLAPNFKTFTALGLLTSKNRKLLALQEFERSLESLSNEKNYNTKDYGETLLGLSKLFIIDDNENDSVFISIKDRDAGLIRIKNYLEKYSLSWPFGYNNSETWWFLSKVYEILDDKPLLNNSLWRCIDLEDVRPARDYNCCDSFNY